MTFSPLIMHAVIIALSAAGFYIAVHIYRKKEAKKPLMCPMHARCDLVTGSRYARFMGVPVEAIGIIYYGGTALLHIFSLFAGAALAAPVGIALMGISTAAFVF